MITQERLKELFDYRDDGHLVWKKSDCVWIKKGMLLGCSTQQYRMTNLDGKMRAVHRLIFLYHHGYLPEILDHIDCNKQNNRIENLRPATRSSNGANIGLTAKNTSGFKGVVWDKSREKWIAAICVNKKTKHLGRYKEKEDAYAAYCQAAKKIFGEFARFE